MNFDNDSLNLYVVVTMTNWSEPPRIRHEFSKLIAENNNVLFIQIHSQRSFRRKKVKVSPKMIVTKLGISFPGVTRLFWKVPGFRKVYYHYVSLLIKKIIKKFKYNKVILINFQYDFPEVSELNIWDAKVYFCNDDFVNQDTNQTEVTRKKKYNLQSRVAGKSDLVITVSDPLKHVLDRFSHNVKLIYSGHSFDTEKSLNHLHKHQTGNIQVCYLGFLGPGVALEWFDYILQFSNISLTLIGPAPNEAKKLLSKRKGFKYINFLTGESLQSELLKYDVFLMPYSSVVANSMTSVPAKLFQYLAIGRPIVSSRMTNLIPLPEKFVYMAETKEEFYSQIMKSYNEDHEGLKTKRIELAKNNSWDARGKEVQGYISEILK